MAGFSEEFLSENEFEPVCNTFICYECDENASEALENIAADK